MSMVSIYSKFHIEKKNFQIFSSSNKTNKKKILLALAAIPQNIKSAVLGFLELTNPTGSSAFNFDLGFSFFFKKKITISFLKLN